VFTETYGARTPTPQSIGGGDETCRGRRRLRAHQPRTEPRTPSPPSRWAPRTPRTVRQRQGLPRLDPALGQAVFLVVPQRALSRGRPLHQALADSPGNPVERSQMPGGWTPERVSNGCPDGRHFDCTTRRGPHSCGQCRASGRALRAAARAFNARGRVGVGSPGELMPVPSYWCLWLTPAGPARFRLTVPLRTLRRRYPSERPQLAGTPPFLGSVA
jgi:hypothetical protein